MDGIVRTADISITAPELPTPLVRRPHLIETIEKIFQSDVDVVCVEAPSGYGKTILLLEFATLGNGTSFVAFLGSASRVSHDPAFVRHDMADQLYWFLQSKRRPPDQDLTDGDLRALWRRSATHLSRQGKTGYVLVDGLHHLSARDIVTRDAILDLLPVGIPPFKVLLSGTADDILTRRMRKMRVKPFTISAFAARETDEYLEDLLPEKATRYAYHSALGGVPYLLASVRRQLAHGGTTSGGFDPTGLTEINSVLEHEWHSQIQPDDDALRKLLATVLAHGRPVATETLSMQSGVSADNIQRWFHELPLVTYSLKSNGWQFCSDQLRDLARTKLRKEVDEAMGQIVSRLLQDPDSDASISQLPNYLDQLGASDVLMEWLTERRMAAILMKQRSVASLDSMLRSAVRICHDRRSDGALTLYSLSRAILNEISHATGMEKRSERGPPSATRTVPWPLRTTPRF